MTGNDDGIEALVRRLEEAWNAGDAAAWVQDCLDDADFINIRGEILAGRRASETRHAFMFVGPFKGSRLAISIRSTKLLSSDVAVVETDCRLSGAPRMPSGVLPTEDGLLLTRLKQVLVRRDGRWWIAASQNTAVIPGPP